MKKRILSMLMVFMMLVGMLPQMAFAGTRVENKDQVRVIVENTTYSEAPWTGTLVDTWVDIDGSSTMMSCVVDALAEKGYTQTGAESGFISEVNGLGIGVPDSSSGWMGSLNDWFTNEGFDAYTVASGKLEDGDEIRIMFSSYGYGEDLGGTWANNDKTVKALAFSAGTLDKSFSAGEHEYTLTLPEGTTGVKVMPTAANKNFQVRTSAAGTEYKRTETVPVENGTVITVACGDPAWPSMNSGEFGTGAENVPAEVYTINVVVEESIKGTEVSVENNVIDIADNKFASLSSYYATINALTISGGEVVAASQDGTDIYVVLSSATAANEQITADFNYSVNKFTVSQNVKTVTLIDGKADLSVTLDGKYSGSFSKGKATYNLHFSCEKAPTTVPVLIREAETIDVKAGLTEKLKLKDYFRYALEYYQVVDGELVKLDENFYNFSSATGGEHKLVFTASNAIGICEDYLEVTFNVDAIESGLWICEETSNGALNSVVFSDADGNAIEGLEGYYDAAKHEITVLLPKDYPVNGTVKAAYNLTQNSDVPFITTKTGTSGTSSGKAVNNKFTEKTVALNNGAATFTFYYYNTTPTNRNNVYTTFKVNYAIKNDLPILATGQEAETSATITAGEFYRINLESLFTDIDGDPLTYKVKVNGESAAADANYEFSTLTAGEYTLVFTANDGKGDSADTYTVNLTVKNVDEKGKMTVNVPEGLQPEFYAANGFENEIDVPGDKLEATALETVDGMTSYEVSFPLNAEYVSVRTEEWGGMAFAAEADKTVTLRQVKIQATNLKGEPADSITAAGYGEYKAYGKDGQYLLVTGVEYKYEAAPVNSGTYENASLTEALEEGDAVLEISMTLKYKNAKTITAPAGATVQMFKYTQYYSQTELETKGGLDNGDGTITWYFTPGDRDQLNYRVSMEGKITKTGYLGYNDNNIRITYSEDDAAPDTTKSTGGATAVSDSGAFVNVNGQNNLVMSEGGTYKLKGYRTWEIIRNQTNNHIITPDFHFNVISGQDVVEVSGVKSNSNGGSGDFSDWRNVKALKNGVAIIEVSYDAVQVTGGDYPGIYGATDSARTGLVVVQVGGHDPTVKFGIDSFASKGSVTYSAGNARDWDAEFDTLYFTGDYGELKFSPTASGGITAVAVSNDKGGSWTALEAEGGVYTAKIASGNNIIRVTTNAGTAYQVVRGDKVTSILQEKEGDGDGIIEAGETIRVMFDGLHTPIPKMAGNYNPGYSGNTDGYSQVHIKYTVNDEVISGPGTQYNFGLAANYVDVTIPEDYEGDIVSLKDGYIGVGVIGLTNFVDGGDSHRNIPDAGCGTRGSQTSYHTRSIMPEVDIAIGGTVSGNMPPKVKDDAAVEASVEMGQKYALNPETLFEDPDRDELTFTVSVNGGEAVTAAADYRFEPSAEGEYELTFTASDEELSVSHSIRLTVTAASQEEDEELVFDISGSQVKGYVNVSIEDNGVRVEGETGLKYPVALGTIVEETKVPYADGDTIADVTLRLLDAKKMGYDYSGTTKSGFYLSAIKKFIVDGVPYDEMGEFDAGQGSGWMITHNDTFIGAGASEFTVKDGDTVIWKYTCQLGADVGDPFYAEEIQNVVELIKAIGEVTLKSEDAINAARTAYDALDENKKAAVKNYDDLTAAEKTLSVLKQEAAANEEKANAAEKLISGIGDVTLESELAIIAARTAYDALTDSQKELVDNYDILQAAEKTLASLKEEAAANEEKAEAVEALIDAIGEVTLESEDAITAARTAYDALTDAQKALVDNYGTLQTAENALAALKQEAAANEEKAAAVEAMIDAIGDVTLDSELDIVIARAAYDLLTDAQKELVDNYDVLVEAEAMLEQLKQEAEEPEHPDGPDVELEYRAVISNEITPSEILIAVGLNTADKIAEAMQEGVASWLGFDDEEAAADVHTELFDIKLMVSEDDGKTWRVATDEDISGEGVEVELLFKDIPGVDFVSIYNEYEEFSVFRMLASATEGYSAGEAVEASCNFGDSDDFDRLYIHMYESAPVAFTWYTYEDAEDIDISEATVESIPDQIYTGEEIYPEIVVKYNDEALEYGWDYELEIIDNIEVGTATVVIYGMNGFSGTKKVEFDIVEAGQEEPDSPDAKDKEKAAKVEALIDAIGEVTLDNEMSITVARTAYNALTDVQKALVSNYSTLQTAEKALQQLKQEVAENGDAAAVVEALIEAIGQVTVDSETAIKVARAAYAELTDAQKALVDNYNILQTAENVLEKLKQEAAANEEKAEAVEVLIEAIGEVTLESGQVISIARAAYDTLTEAQKALVENYNMLQDAEDTFAGLKQEAAEREERIANVEALIDAIGEVTLDSGDAIKAARQAFDALSTEEKTEVNNYEKLELAERKLEALNNPRFEEVYKDSGEYLKDAAETMAPTVNATGGEWLVLGLTRSGYAVPAGYYNNVIKYVNENINDKGQLHRVKSTENSRVILALTAAGIDPTDIDGHNLLEGLTDMSYVQKQGINGPIWALIAFDSHGYEMPAGGDVTREALIRTILDAQLSDGGWALSGSTSDVDMTGMALQALAPYCNVNAEVKAAVDKALDLLSKEQNADGTFGSVDGPCAESCAQVIVALTALGIDPAGDSRFVKNGFSAVDGLLDFAIEGGGFRHVYGGKLDGMATEQGYYALAAYDRFLNGKTSLYDMSDVTIGGDAENPDMPDNPVNPEDPDTPDDPKDTEDTDKEDEKETNKDDKKKAEGKTKSANVKLKKSDKENADDEELPVQTNPSIGSAEGDAPVIWPWLVAAAAAIIALIAVAVIRSRK